MFGLSRGFVFCILHYTVFDDRYVRTLQCILCNSPVYERTKDECLAKNYCMKMLWTWSHFVLETTNKPPTDIGGVPSLKLTLCLKMDGWKNSFLMGPGLFSFANCQFHGVSVVQKNENYLSFVASPNTYDRSEFSQACGAKSSKK